MIQFHQECQNRIKLGLKLIKITKVLTIAPRYEY